MKSSVATILCMLLATQAFGQETLDELLQKVKQSRQDLERESQVVDGHWSQSITAKQLDDARTELMITTTENDQLNAQVEANKRGLDKISETQLIETGDLSELFGVVRLYAVDAAGALKGSLVSAQLGDRSGLLSKLAETETIPSPEDLYAFYTLMIEEMTESGKVSRFETEVVNAAGVPTMAEIVRVGMFNLISNDSFLRYEVNNGTIQELARQPANRHRSDAKTLFQETDGVVAMAIDPTAGQLLGLLIQTPNVVERIRQGGPVGYIIVALGFLGLVIGVYRLLYMGAAGRRIKRQLKSDTPDESNALGRILGVYARNPGADTETLELKLDEAIIKETPRLEKWQMALKVIAAVAPLLGLLGTVIGMIETFQQITLFGTSDPRLMAAGISKALVTTMLGLLVAIPVVLIHSMVASRSKHLIEILEEQSAAIIASQAEKKR